MNSKYLKSFLLFLICTALILPVVDAKEKDKGKKLSKTQGLPNRTFLNINNLSTQIYNDGNSDIKPDGNSGLIYPKGSGKGAVFESGFIWGAFVGNDPQVRVGGSTYSQGLQGGKILSPGVAESPDLDKNRIYRVRPDVFPGGPDIDLSLAALDEGNSASALRTQYESDWTNWPAADGAPYRDVDSNGAYDPNVDIPGVPGADQTIWFVANDLDANKTTDLYGAQPMGIEMQATIWAYAQAGALGNMFFRKYLIINKSTDTFNNMIVSMWSDVDDGNATDDFAGCDTTLSLGYVYNANAEDATYAPLNPPAVGFDFFQGPVVTGAPTDTAIFQGKLVMGKKNLPMTAFYYFARGDATVTDPTLGDIQGSTQFYNFMQGKVGINGKRFVNPVTGDSTSFVLTGDPQTGEGWIDGNPLSAGDRRIGSASGPFNMAPGDTQEVVVAEIVAGASGGVSNIDAVGLLKTYDKKAQEAYDNFFILPSPPPKPNVQVAELDKELVLNWGASLNDVAATESFDFKGFKFEGYNVYQLPSAGAQISEAKRLATFDLTTDPSTVLGPVVDPTSGVTIVVPQQYGNNGGIKRVFRVTKNYLTNTPLVNGNRYYFAVTAYAYSPDSLAVPNNLENPLSIITAIPHSPNPGVRYNSGFSDTLSAEHTQGASDGAFKAVVVDPSKVTGDTYTVSFVVDADTASATFGQTLWNLKNSAGTMLLANQTKQYLPGESAIDAPIVDGMQFIVFGPAPGLKAWDIPSGTRRFSWAGGFAGLGLEGFIDPTPTTIDRAAGTLGMAGNFQFGGIGTTLTNNDYHTVLLKLAPIHPDSTDPWNPLVAPQTPNISRGYRYLRAAASAPADSSFAPWIINPEAGYPYQDYNYSVPFSAWDQTTTPPTRLMVGFLENNVAGASVDGRYLPPQAADGDNSVNREFMFIFATPYSETPDTNLTQNISGNASMPLMWVGTFNVRSTIPWVDGDLTDGDQFEIIANVPNTVNDIFAITAPTVTSNLDLAKEDVGKVNVYPNPYYGVNSEEINKYNRFVTFTHLPGKATIRIFNLAGVLVQTILKDDPSQFTRWNLANQTGLPVASGLYIAHIEMPELGITKILKLAIIQEQQILDRF